MVVIQGRGRTKPNGARLKSYRGKRLYEAGGLPVLTKIAKKKIKSVRTMGGNFKIKMLSTDSVNLYDPKSKKFSQVKLTTVVDNAANRHFVRRNILTKGAVIMTEKGKAKITSRPGQHGVVNAVLVE